MENYHALHVISGQPAASPWDDTLRTIIYRIIPPLHLITNSTKPFTQDVWISYWVSHLHHYGIPVKIHCKTSIPSVTYYTAIFLQTSRYRHDSVTVWETRHIKTIWPVQNRGLTWYRRSHMGTLIFNSHCTWTRQCSHRTVQFPQRHVRC